MATKKRLSPNQLAELKGEFSNLKQIQNYTSLNSEFKVEAIEQVETELDDLLAEEPQLVARLADVRDQIADKGTLLTRKMKGARQQVIAQFGDDSAEIQSLGNKRASERRTGKRPSRGGTAPAS